MFLPNKSTWSNGCLAGCSPRSSRPARFSQQAILLLCQEEPYRYDNEQYSRHRLGELLSFKILEKSLSFVALLHGCLQLTHDLSLKDVLRLFENCVHFAVDTCLNDWFAKLEIHNNRRPKCSQIDRRCDIEIVMPI